MTKTIVAPSATLEGLAYAMLPWRIADRLGFANRAIDRAVGRVEQRGIAASDAHDITVVLGD
jgi:hypothetical protein